MWASNMRGSHRTKPRRKPPRRIADLSVWIVPGGLGLFFVLLTAGFIHFTRTTLYKQANFAAGAEHPDDWVASLCLLLGLIALAGIFLSLREAPPMRWRRRRTGAGAKHALRHTFRHNLRRPKPRRRSGTIGT